MNTPRKLTNAERLDLLLDAEIDDLINASDEDILKEAAEIHSDVPTVAAKLRSLIDSAVTEAGKRRLANARSIINAEHGKASNVLSFPLEGKRTLIASLRQNANIKTLAARKGESETENDLNSLLEDLIDIGVIDEEGNLL